MNSDTHDSDGLFFYKGTLLELVRTIAWGIFQAFVVAPYYVASFVLGAIYIVSIWWLVPQLLEEHPGFAIGYTLIGGLIAASHYLLKETWAHSGSDDDSKLFGGSIILVMYALIAHACGLF